jgi:hypothetical protein
MYIYREKANFFTMEGTATHTHTTHRPPQNKQHTSTPPSLYSPPLPPLTPFLSLCPVLGEELPKSDTWEFNGGQTVRHRWEHSHLTVGMWATAAICQGPAQAEPFADEMLKVRTDVRRYDREREGEGDFRRSKEGACGPLRPSARDPPRPSPSPTRCSR